MPLTWLVPAAWGLAAFVALPIAVHLLAQRRRRPLRFPTLRFLDEVAAPARRHWTVRDPWLLLVRMAIVAAVAAALAAPLLVTASRQVRWDAPLAQALVVTPAVADEAAARLPVTGGEQQRFVTDDVRAGLADAAAWLASHGLSRREIVVVGPLTRDALGAADLRAVPGDIGVRFVRAGVAPPAPVERGRLQLIDGTLWRITEAVQVDGSGTTVSETTRVVSPSRVLEPQAPPAEREAAEAARRAVLRRGVVLDRTVTAPIAVPWTGDVATFAAAVDAHAGDVDGHDPTPIADADLAAMTRPPAPRGSSTPVDEGDRRVAWLMVLALLGVEAWLRRRPA